MNEEENLKRQAEEFARLNKKRIAKELTDPAKFIPDEVPISVFMAGSPGAGKTEVSKNLINMLENNKKHKVIRVDGDELRQHIPGYTGSNSYLFQGAVSILVDKIHDLALDQKQTFLLDGTLSKYDKAASNIKRSLDRNRVVLIFYVYQKPEVAWKFTVAREALEGRNIPKSAFIESFLESRDTVCRIRKDFDGRVVIFLVKKNFETHNVDDILEIIADGKQIDDYLGKAYTKDDLEKLL
jgi:UDP-N-acetylglucosamine kinase